MGEYIIISDRGKSDPTCLFFAVKCSSLISYSYSHQLVFSLDIYSQDIVQCQGQYASYSSLALISNWIGVPARKQLQRLRMSKFSKVLVQKLKVKHIKVLGETFLVLTLGKNIESLL